MKYYMPHDFPQQTFTAKYSIELDSNTSFCVANYNIHFFPRNT